MNQSRIVRLFSLLLFGVAAICTIAWVVLPRQQAIARQRTELTAQKHYIEQAITMGPPIQQMESELSAAQSYVHQCRGETSSGHELVSVFAAVTEKAQDAGVEIDRFQPEPPTNIHDAFRQLGATLVVEGTFSQVFDFVGQLEHLPMALWLDEFRIQQADDHSENLTCEMTLVVFSDNNEDSGYTVSADNR